MSLADITALKNTMIADWLHRSDITTSQAGDFITLFESDFNSTMRVRQMEQETTITSTTGYLLHPTNWLGWKEIRGTFSGKQYNLHPLSDEIALKLTSGDVPPARYYKPTGSRTYLYPPPSATAFPTKYWEGVALTSGTNWLLTAFPGAYLYGGLLQATAYIVDDPRLPVWQSAYENILAKIRESGRLSSWSGQALQPLPEVRLV